MVLHNIGDHAVKGHDVLQSKKMLCGQDARMFRRVIFAHSIDAPGGEQSASPSGAQHN